MRSNRKRLLCGLFAFSIVTGALAWYIWDSNREKDVSKPQALEGDDVGIPDAVEEPKVESDADAGAEEVVSVDADGEKKKSGAIDVQTMGQGETNREEQLVKTDVLTKEKERSSNARIADATVLGQGEKAEPEVLSRSLKRVQVNYPPRPTLKPREPVPLDTCPSLKTRATLKVAKRYPDFPAFLYNTILDYSECNFVNHSLETGAIIVDPRNVSQPDTTIQLKNLEQFFKSKCHQKRCSNFSLSDQNDKTTWLFAANRKLDCSNFILGESLNENDLKRAVDLINLGLTVSIKDQPDGRYWFSYTQPRYAVEKFYEANVMQWIFQIIRLKLGISYDKDAIIQLMQNYSQVCKAEQPICNCPKEWEYSFDGTCNSQHKSKSLTGKSVSAFSRIGRPFCSLNSNYADLNLPNAREVSLLLAYITNVIENCDESQFAGNRSLSMFGLYMAEFIFADVSQLTHTSLGLMSHEGLNGCTNEKSLLHESLRHTWTHPIEISEDDPVYGGIRCMNYIKAQRLNLNCEFSEPSLANLQTSYLDLSQLYGNDQNCVLYGEKGKIVVTETGLLKMIDYRAYSSAPQLLTWQIWSKIHNIIAGCIAQKFPGKSDHYYFKLTRKTLIYIYQRYVYVKVLPKLLGEHFSKRQNISSDQACYQEPVDPTTIIEFSCAAIKVLHGYLPDKIPLLKCSSDSTKVVGVKEFKNRYGGYSIFAKNQTEELFNGLRETPLSMHKRGFQVHNQLFKDNFKQGVDLIALDVQRTRDCCLRSYAHYIEILNGRKITCWNDYIKFGYFTNETVSALQILYCRHDLVDLYVGMSLEVRGDTELGGSTWRRVMAESFLHFKHGDNKNFANALNQNQKQALAKVNVPALIALALKQNTYAEDPLRTKSNILPINDRNAGVTQFVVSLLG